VRTIKAALLSLAAIAAVAGTAFAQQAPRILGEVESVAGHEVTVKTRDGKTVQARLDDQVRVLHAAKASLADIKPGTFVGTGALPDGKDWKAAEVHIMDSPQSEGHRVWSSNPAGTMTNANVTATAVSAGNGKLTLTTGGQDYTINVPPEAPIVHFQPGTPDLVKKGAWVELSNTVQSEGVTIVKAITVSDDRRYPVR